jgi:hypothetical protein
MKRNVTSFLLVLLVACFSVTAVGNGDNPKPRPFKGSMSGEATFDFVSGACSDVTGAPWQTLSYLTGDLSHLGESEWFTSHCSTLDGQQLVNGEATLVAANGDEIWMTYTADLIPPLIIPGTVMYIQDNVVVGGTGRFEGASGKFLTLVAVTIDDPTALTTPVSGDFAGTISY